jgi:hypothetical protein
MLIQVTTRYYTYDTLQDIFTQQVTQVQRQTLELRRDHGLQAASDQSFDGLGVEIWMSDERYIDVEHVLGRLDSLKGSTDNSGTNRSWSWIRSTFSSRWQMS